MKQAMLGHEIIDLEKLTKPEIMALKRRRTFFCIRCKKPVIFKNGTRKRAHFAHEKTRLSVGSSESAAHVLVKHLMINWLKRQQIRGDIEKRFPTINRIADVYFEYKTVNYVLEIQKSPMSDAEFKQRTSDYERVDIKVLWIFLGMVEEKEGTFRLPSVMLGREASRLFHFCVKTTQFQIFERPVFVTARTIYAKQLRGKLSEFSVEDLLETSEKAAYFDQSWLAVKKQFRRRNWFYVSKSEKRLREQCLIHGFNLSLLPTEIGWPVDGNGIKKQLFVWQAYVLLTVMKHVKVGGVFSLTDVWVHLQREYGIARTKENVRQVQGYLKWLIMFGIVEAQATYFVYVKCPKMSVSMEVLLQRDKKFVETVEKLWQV
ncbi:MAG: hypothetical protein FWG67_03235 [Defluviitaleaceae bacterium]|nr:hypothetical protein [Defluviitaleaceae bacterium]